MADLKIDLMNKIGNDKYYAEMELARLADNTNVSYKNKIEEMCEQLDNISRCNSNSALVEFYFRKPEDDSAKLESEVRAEASAEPVGTKLT